MGFGKDFKFGDAAKTGSLIEQIKLVEDEIKFISILSVDEAIVAKTHFMMPLGRFYCWRTEDEDGIIQKGSCCTTMAELGKSEYAQERLVVPVVVYTTVDKRTFQEPVTFGRLEISADEYKQLLSVLDDEDIPAEDTPKHVFRIKGTSVGKGQFTRISPEFKYMNTKSLALTNESVKLQAKDFLVKYKELIRDCVGKTIDEAKLQTLALQAKTEQGEITTQTNPNADKPATPELPSVEVPDIELEGDSFDVGDVLADLGDDFLND